MAPVFV